MICFMAWVSMKQRRGAFACVVMVGICGCSGGGRSASPGALSTAPTVSGNYPFVPRVGAAVPPITLSGLDFLNAEDGYALIGPRFEYADGVTGIAATHDGGRTWTAVATDESMRLNGPGAGAAFVSVDEGFVWSYSATTAASEVGASGRSLLRTTDAGKSWTVVPNIRQVEALTVRGPDVWVIASRVGPSSVSQAVEIWRSSDGGDHWEDAGPEPALTQLDVIGSSDAYAMTGAGIVETSNGGRSWTLASRRPCKPLEGADGTLAAAAPNELWFLCGGEPGVGAQSKQLYISTTGGHIWAVAAETAAPGSGAGAVGEIPSGGYVDALTAVSSHTLYMSLSRSGLDESTDSGTNWTVAIRAYADTTEYSMYSATGGIALLDGKPWSTTDGTWHPVN